MGFKVIGLVIHYPREQFKLGQHWPNVGTRVRHNRRNGVSYHQPHGCLLNRLFRRRSTKTSKFRVTGLCERNSPVSGEFPSQRPVTQSLDVLCDLCLSKHLSKQSWGWWWVETPSHPLRRHINERDEVYGYWFGNTVSQRAMQVGVTLVQHRDDSTDVGPITVTS